MTVRDHFHKKDDSEHESSVFPVHDFVRFDLNGRRPPEGSIPPLLHVSENGKILWGSSPALKLLRSYWKGAALSAQLPTPLRRMVSGRSPMNGASPSRLKNELLIGGRQGACLHVRLIEDNKRLLFLFHERPTWPSAHGLTKRELEVFQWLAVGKSNKDIGTILAISPRTVEKHLERIFQYLGVETRTAAAAEFYRLSHDPPPSSP